jgi:serine/threonine-protein kinase
MSPAQASGEPATAANDLWSIAAVAYWMLLGREPFTGRMLSETLHRIRIGKFTLPTELAPELPPSLDGFFARAFSLDPQHRFQSAEELALAFRAALTEVNAGTRSELRAIGISERGGPRKLPGPFRRSLILLAIATSLVLLLTLVVRRAEPPERAAAAPESRAANAQASIQNEVRSSAQSAPTPHDPSASSAASGSVRAAPSASTLRSSRSGDFKRASNAAQALPPNALTQAKPAVTAPSSDSVDPLFGISVKSRRSDADAFRGSGGAAGAFDRSQGVRDTP